MPIMQARPMAGPSTGQLLGRRGRACHAQRVTCAAAQHTDAERKRAQVRGLLKHSRALAPSATAPPLCVMDPAHVVFFAPRLADARRAALAALDSAAPGAGRA